MKLKYSQANAKTKRLRDIPELQKYLANRRKVYSLDMLSGWTCPGACDCKSKVHIIENRKKLFDGPKTQFRCFSASQEALYTNVYNARLHNWNLMNSMKSQRQCRQLILNSLPNNLGINRYHVGGDFFKRTYLYAALDVAQIHPDKLFYAYTKSLHFLDGIDMIDPENGIILPNFLVTTSKGGKYDNLIPKLGIRTATVVFSENDTTLPIDHDDSHAATMGGSFALLLHGVQPKGSEAAVALKELKGKGSYRN